MKSGHGCTFPAFCHIDGQVTHHHLPDARYNPVQGGLHLPVSICQWHMIPGDVLPRLTLQRSFDDWRERGLVHSISYTLVLPVCAQEEAGILARRS